MNVSQRYGKVESRFLNIRRNDIFKGMFLYFMIDIRHITIKGFHALLSLLIIPLQAAKNTICEKTLFAHFAFIYRTCFGYIFRCSVRIVDAIFVALRG